MLDYIARVVTHIGEADDHGSLFVAVQSGLSDLGFESFNLSCNKQRAEQLVLEPTLTTWSPPGIDEYVALHGQDRDPLIGVASSPGQPKIWSPLEWDNSEQYGNYANYLVGYGILSGVTASLTQRPGMLSAITAVSSSVSTISEDTALAIYVIGQAGMIRANALGLADVAPAALGALSADQLEILEWARQGKSNSDIALITNRTKRAVAYHMSEILRKLGVSSRSQAIALYTGQQA